MFESRDGKQVRYYVLQNGESYGVLKATDLEAQDRKTVAGPFDTFEEARIALIPYVQQPARFR